MPTIQPWASTAVGQRREAGEKEAASRRTTDAHALEDARTINGLLGVIADISECLTNVRYSPGSRHEKEY
jgi:hypothetical protein